MAIYRGSIASEVAAAPAGNGGASAGAVLFEIVGFPTAFMLVKNIGFSCSAATFKYVAMGLGFSSQVGAAPSISAPFVPDDPNSPAVPAYLASQWGGSPPGAPTALMRCLYTSNLNAYPRFWYSPRGIGIFPNTSLVVTVPFGLISTGQVVMEVEADV